MLIRNLNEQEKNRFGEIERDAFLIDPAVIPDWLERTYKPETTYGIFEDDGELMSVLRLIYPQLWFGHASITMPGVTSVATPPENRRNGYLNKLLMRILEMKREMGYGISTLYPFEFPFYLRFGYAQVSNTKRIEVSIDALAKHKKLGSGRWKQKSPDDWAEFNALYQKFCVGKFGLISRDEIRWRFNTLMVFGKTNQTSYIWYDDKGEARAYIIYRLRESEPWKRKMMVRDMAWLDGGAYREILSFIANIDSQAQEAVWETAEDDQFELFLDNPRAAKGEITRGFMLRLVDAKLALEQRPFHPDVSGAFSLTIRDDRLEWNDKLTLQMQVEGGKATVKAEKLQADNAGLACDVRQLSQFYMSFLTPLNAAKMGMLEVRNQRDLQAAQAVFFPPNQPVPFMADFW
jgi:predicted acetyltransferase